MQYSDAPEFLVPLHLIMHPITLNPVLYDGEELFFVVDPDIPGPSNHNFIQRRTDEMKQRQEHRVTVENNVTTITISDSDSDSSTLKEIQQKRKKMQNRRNKKFAANIKSNELVDLSSTMPIEDSGEPANENSVQKRLNAEKENTLQLKEIDSDTKTRLYVESLIPLANFIPLDNAQINGNTSEDNAQINGNTSEHNALDSTIILSDSPLQPDFISLSSSKEKENIPSRIDDSDIIIEAEILKPIDTKPKCLRPIVIDGSNVAREHGKVSNTFSCKGIQIAVNYFLQKGHEQVTAFVPHYRRHNKFGPILTTDQPLLEELAKEQHVVFTPSRRIENKRVTCYDDRFIVELATKTGGVILSNDNYRDLAAESEEFKKTINERLLMFCFVGDLIMIPQDPLGRTGPSLENFLSFPENPV